jgi:glyoxylase-like metal-dependent hydrolase (beta-lactamase superfamily II)
MTTTEAPTGADAVMETVVPNLYATAPEQLPFARTLNVRAFLVRREQGNILIYSTKALAAYGPAIDGLGGVSRHYLNHWHESLLASEGLDAPLFVHEAEREQVRRPYEVRATFSRRHMVDDDFEVIPIPGHTPGATAFVWDSGDHRVLFTGDTIELIDGEWTTAVLESSDPRAYIESLELIRALDFDLLVPWAASGDGRSYAATNRSDADRRLGESIERLRDVARSRR